jgi:hypothetical protein
VTPQAEYVVDFPTLWVAIDWTERHCIIPDRDQKGQPFVHYDWQLWVSVNWYRIKPKAKVGDFATAFFYRRVQIVGPQKYGKGPGAAALIVAQARGPVVFDGWAEGGEVYDCADHGCGCGWTYTYRAGEPMGRPWATPLIQLTGTSDDAIDRNAYGYVKSMLRYGPLADQVTVGEVFTRLPNDGLIETVTSSSLSRLGNPIIFALQDETGTYTDTNKLRKVAETQRRGAAGMGGRTLETTNAWDPGEDSVAQRTYEAKAKDIFRFWRNPDAEPSLMREDGTPFRFSNKRERRAILRWVYQGAAHVESQLDGIEAEALELMEKDPGQAERFFGNRALSGHGVWLVPERWNSRKRIQVIEPKIQVVGGFDGSDIDDLTGFRLETREAYQFTPTFPDGRPMIWDPADYQGKVPRTDVNAAMAHIAATYHLVRLYGDPPYWESEMDAWAELYDDEAQGKHRIIRWYTRRPTQMHAACERLYVDLGKADSGFWHDGCEITRLHVEAAHRFPRPAADNPGRYILRKPGDGRKIDMTIPSVLAHEAWGDVTAEGWPEIETESFVYYI